MGQTELMEASLEEETAALKIQAISRGRAARKEIERFRAEGQAAKARELQATVTECKEQQEAAAEKIQAIQRGRAARKEVELLKMGKRSSSQSVSSNSPKSLQAKQNTSFPSGAPSTGRDS